MMKMKNAISIPEHRDFLERKLTVGDMVIVVIHNSFRLARITQMTPKMIRIQLWDTRGFAPTTTIRYPREMMIAHNEYVTMYMIKHSKT